MESIIKKLKEQYSSLIEDYPKGGFYYTYYDPEYGPGSSGNDQDVYDDGFNSGFDQGKLDIIVQLLKDLGEDSEVDYKRLQEDVK